MWFCASAGADASKLTVEEYEMGSGGWHLLRSKIQLDKAKKIFAPANLRAAAENEEFHSIVLDWIRERYTLRYTGGMVRGDFVFVGFGQALVGFGQARLIPHSHTNM